MCGGELAEAEELVKLECPGGRASASGGRGRSIKSYGGLERRSLGRWGGWSGR